MHADRQMTGRPGRLAGFLGLTFTGSWLAWGLAHPDVQRALGLAVSRDLLIAVGTAVPSTVALLMAACEGTARPLLAGLTRWRVHPVWYAIAILSPPSVMLAAMGGHVLLGGEAPSYPTPSRWPLVAINFVGVVLLGGPLGEELGWRGLALPVLRSRLRLLAAALVLGVIWAAWHLPLFVLPGSPQSELPLGGFALQTVALSLILALVYEGSGRSLLLPVLLHASVNAFSGPLRILPAATGSERPFILTVLLAWVAAGFLAALRRRGMLPEGRD